MKGDLHTTINNKNRTNPMKVVLQKHHHHWIHCMKTNFKGLEINIPDKAYKNSFKVSIVTSLLPQYLLFL